MTIRQILIAALVSVHCFYASCLHASEFAVEVLEYLPAPGQFVNNPDYNDENDALGPPNGFRLNQPDNTNKVALGGFGGFIVLKFDHTVMDNPRNPMGLDSIAFGNAFWVSPVVPNPYWRWQEPGTIEISRDENGNGLADDNWYLMPGSHIDYPSTHWTSISYHRTDPNYSPEDKSHYPSLTYFPDYPDLISLYGFLLPDEIVGNYANPNEGVSDKETVWGYCDISPTVEDAAGDGEVYLIPDNPYTVGLIEESGGGDAFDIADAVDPITGEASGLDGFDFIRITTASNYVLWSPALFEISTEVDAVSDVKAFEELRGFWRFDEENSTQIDSGTYDNSGIVDGAIFLSSGRVGGAYWFDGQDDSINVEEHFTLDMVDEMTLTCWIKLSKLPSSKTESTKDATIISKGRAGTETEMNYELLVDENDYLVFRFYDGEWVELQSDQPFALEDVDTWRKAAFIYGRNTGIAKLFLDENCVGMTVFPGKLPMNDGDLFIGARCLETGTENHFPGAIDEVKLECVECPAFATCLAYWNVDGDTDADDLPDLWEINFFGNLSPTPEDDPDLDNHPNLAELRAGTKPNNDTSFFGIVSISSSLAGAQLSIQTVKGWNYTILCSEDIGSMDWEVAGIITGDGTTMIFVDDSIFAGNERYFRVLAE